MWTSLGAPSRRDAEINEARWWSRWARLSWAEDGSYLLTSDEFAEPFFNRVGAMSCEGVAGAASWAEGKIVTRGLPSTVLIFESCVRGARSLLASGYRIADIMAVLVSKGEISASLEADITIRPSTTAESWVSAYLRAFYQSEELKGAVSPIANRLLGAKVATLLEARVKNSVAGSLAIFRTEGIAGVYCVGTVPEFRGMGVATHLLARAREISDAEGRQMVLQTLASDGAGPFYSRRGFEHLYSKLIMEKES